MNTNRDGEHCNGAHDFCEWLRYCAGRISFLLGYAQRVLASFLAVAAMTVFAPLAWSDQVVIEYAFKSNKRVLVIDENATTDQLETAARVIGEYDIVPTIVFDGAVVGGDTLTAYQLMNNIAAHAGSISAYERIVNMIDALIEDAPVLADRSKSDKGPYRPPPSEPRKPDETGGGGGGPIASPN